MKNIFLYPLLIVLVAGCDRLKMDDSARIQIQLPGVASTASKVSAASSAGTQPVPDGMSGVAGVSTPINCYIIGVGGPEAEMSRNICTKADGTKVFSIGQWAGGIPAGGTASLDVSSGKNRNFYVIGVHAVGNNCADFKAGFPEDDVLSKPYIVGKIENVTLNAGETKDLPIPVAFDSNAAFDDCVGPDFPKKDGGGGNSNSPPTHVKFRKEYFPANIFQEGTCQSIDVSLTNSSGNGGGSLSFPVTFALGMNGAATQVFNNISDCTNNTNSLSTVTIPAGSNYQQFSFKTPLNSTAPMLNLIPTSISPSLGALPLMSIPNLSAGVKTFEMDTPMQALSGICYPMTVNLKNVNGSAAMNYGTVNASITAQGVTFYSESNCGTTTSALSFGYGITSVTTYFKMASVNSSAQVTLSDTSAGGYQSTSKTIYSGQGSANATQLVISGYNQLSGREFCQGYQVYPANEYKVPVPAPNTINYNVTFSPSGFDTKTDVGCMTSGTTPINAGSFGNKFYAYANTLAAYGNKTFQANATGFTGVPFNVSVDGPFAWKLNIQPSVNDTVCFPFMVEQTNYSGSLANDIGYGSFQLSLSSPNVTAATYTDGGCTTGQNIFSTTPGTSINASGGPYLQLFMKLTITSGGAQSVNIQLIPSSAPSLNPAMQQVNILQ